jgi:RNA polymerase sigma-70 factor, ECF subfamily
MRGRGRAVHASPVMSRSVTTATPRLRLLDPEAAAVHLDRLYRFAWSLCGSSQLADELTQETYARVLARPRRLHGDSEFQYLTQTLRNLLRDHWRAEYRAPPMAGGDALECERSTDGDPEAAALAGDVFAAVGRLPAPMREIVGLVDVAGLTYAEAAEALEIPIGTVMSRLHRARSRVAGEVGEPALAA